MTPGFALQRSMPSHGSELAVYCRSITKHFGEGNERVQALRGIDLDVRPGELFMLVGPSGCGKTTLISILAATLDYDDGECTVFGENLRTMTTAQKNAFRAGAIGFVFQAYNLLPTLRAFENAAVPMIINGTPWEDAMKESKAMLARVGLGERANALPSQLSGGQQQRVAIARALVHRPKLIVCDEPTAALDHETGGKVMSLLREIADEGSRTLLIVTHDPRIFHVADRIAEMDDGKILRVTEAKNFSQASPT